MKTLFYSLVAGAILSLGMFVFAARPTPLDLVGTGFASLLAGWFFASSTREFHPRRMGTLLLRPPVTGNLRTPDQRHVRKAA